MRAMPRWRLRQTVRALEQGEVVAYPTEAVFGLGCDPWNPAAVRQILQIKRRPWHKGLILIAANLTQLTPFIAPLSAEALEKVKATWPGPVTWLVPASSYCPDYLTGQHTTIAVRVTAHPQARALCQAYGGAIVSTSANRTGHKPARTLREVKRALPEVNVVLTGCCGDDRRPTQIRDIQTGERVR